MTLRPIFNGLVSDVTGTLVHRCIETFPSSNGPVEVLRLAIKCTLSTGKQKEKKIIARFGGEFGKNYQGQVGDTVVLSGGAFDIGQETDKTVLTLQMPRVIETSKVPRVHVCETSGVLRISADKPKKDGTGTVYAIRSNAEVKGANGSTTDVLNLKAFYSGYDKSEKKSISIAAEVAGWNQSNLAGLKDKNGAPVLQPLDNVFIAHAVPTVEFADGYANLRLTGKVGLLYNARGATSNGAPAEAAAAASNSDPFGGNTSDGGVPDFDETAPAPF